MLTIEPEKLVIMIAVLEDLKIKYAFQEPDNILFISNDEKTDNLPSKHYRFVIDEMLDCGVVKKIEDKKSGFYIIINIDSLIEYKKEIEYELSFFLPETPKKKIDKTTKFDVKNSILFLSGCKIKIARQNKETMAHLVLQYLFKNDHEGFYSEMAEDILEIDIDDYKNNKKYWRKFHTACVDIDLKIKKISNNLITDFLNFNTGFKGRVFINDKYLN